MLYTRDFCFFLFTVNYGLFAVSIIIILFSVIRVVIEIVQVYLLRLTYFFELENWLEVFLFVSSIIFVSYGLESGCQCPASWQWQFGALILLVAWLNLVLFLKKLPLTGVYVLMFLHTLYTFMKMILLSALFVISFGLTFYMIFYRPVSPSYMLIVVLYACNMSRKLRHFQTSYCTKDGCSRVFASIFCGCKHPQKMCCLQIIYGDAGLHK